MLPLLPLFIFFNLIFQCISILLLDLPLFLLQFFLDRTIVLKIVSPLYPLTSFGYRAVIRTPILFSSLLACIEQSRCSVVQILGTVLSVSSLSHRLSYSLYLSIFIILYIRLYRLLYKLLAPFQFGWPFSQYILLSIEEIDVFSIWTIYGIFLFLVEWNCFRIARRSYSTSIVIV